MAPEHVTVPTDSVERSTITRTVANRLRSEIFSGFLAPGQRLRQEEIAHRLGVSTTPVREALRILQAEGVVQLDPHRGVQIFEPTPEDLTDIYDIRGVLEVLAIAGAVSRIDNVTFAKLGELIDAMDSVQDPSEWLKLNRAFHFMIYEASGRTRLLELISNLEILSSGYVRMIVPSTMDSGRARLQHQLILDACQAGDVPGAQQATRDHLNSTVEAILEMTSRPDSG